jgi:hypothetical protein
MYDNKDLVDISHLGLIFQAKPVKYMSRAVHDDILTYNKPENEEDVDRVLRNVLKNKVKFATGGNGRWTLPPGIWMVEKDNGLLILYPEEYKSQPPAVGGA